jgi:hypothetical protein
VNARRKPAAVAAFSALLFVASRVAAVPIEPTAKEILREVERRPVMYIPARVKWHTARKPGQNLSLTLEQYGPQATARAVRASLKVALVPDPVAMAALLFCAFALRWIRLRKEQEHERPQVSEVASDLPLPRAA